MWLEGESPNADLFTAQHPKFLLHLLDKSVDAGAINLFDFLQKVKVAAELLGDSHDGLNVFREAEASEPDPGIQKRCANPWIEANSFRHGCNIRPGSLAQVRNHVDER